MKIYNSNYPTPTISSIGGKAMNLFNLKKLNLNVPEFAVIDQAVLADLIPEKWKDTTFYNQIINLIDAYTFPINFLDDLHESLQYSEGKQYAVRSSALQEDGKDFSFAGQFESHLYVDWKDIPKYIKAVWKSNFSERVCTYLETNSLTPNMGIGVVIQEMIDPDVSGVGFGIDPNTGAENSKVVCAVYGVGEGLVSGKLNADTYHLNKNEITPTIVKKEKQAKRGNSGEIIFDNVSKDLQENPALNDTIILKIANYLEQLEKELKAPQDIEFAIKNSQVYLLQTRPITAILKSGNTSKKGNRIIWDNSNIVESYPGVTTPLTFSYIKTAYKNVYLQLALLMGASKKTIQENETVFANMLGLVNGRVYYNLLSWYKVLALFPGYSLNAEFMENMMGVKERFVLQKDTRINKFSALSRTILMLFKIIGHSLTIKRTSSIFMKDVNDALDRIKLLDLNEMSAYHLKTTWIALDDELTKKWKAPVINDSFAMIYFGRLQKFIEKNKLSKNPNIQNDLLCGSKDIISVEPIHKSIELATKIGADPTLKNLFISSDSLTIWNQLADHPIKKEIDHYINKFGDRCVGELKLETISFKQEPALFIDTLKSFVKQNVTTQSTTSSIDQDLRIAAESEIRAALKYSPYKRYKLNKILNKTRYFVSNRENLRYERTRVFGITREIFNAIGLQFEKNNVLDSSRDIYYLTKDEIFDFIDGTAVTKDLKPLITIRKTEYAQFDREESPAERITTYETVNYQNDFFKNEINFDPKDGLKGLGCCPGIVKAKVRIVKHPKEVESLDGDILVTSSTDPGWVTLFPTASAIIVEKGSLLSHSAIVSREMGIPCIVGVTGLLKQLKTGDVIAMDGSTGEIKRVSDEG